MDAWMLTAVSVLATAACGSRSELPLSSRDSSTAPAETNVLVLNECGPTDGAALTFIFSPSPLACPPPACTRGACPPDPAPATRDVVQIYYALDVGPNTVDFSPGGPNSLGDASSCHGGTCVAATRAEVMLITYTATGRTAGSAEGSYTLLLTDGSTVNGHFTGVICGNGTFCG
jgi:hypothetical protein